MGTDVLFENHSVKEIQEIEKKLRNDIERKKEELRQMVGERYRDLMEAADTITEMKEIAQSVTSCVRSIEDSCSQLQNSSLQKGILHSIQPHVLERKKRNELLYRVSSQIKILMESPTKIWSCIEAGDFLRAVCLFLLCRHTHSLLAMDPAHRRATARFPVVGRQWTTLSHFRHILMQNCQSILETKDTEPEDVLGPLCCICLLSNTSVQQAFSDTLNTRMNVLESVFQPEKSAKVQLCEFVTVVQTTLKMIYYLFFPSRLTNTDEKTNALHHTLKSLTSKGPVSLLDTKSSATYKYLPQEVIDFRPVLNASLDPCSGKMLQSKMNDWLTSVQSKCEAELRGLLNFVTSVQSLSLVREALCNTLCEVSEWNQMCNCLLNRTYSIWDSQLKDCFWQRIEDIINDQVKSASEYCQKDIEDTLYKIGVDTENPALASERGVASYVWAESALDVGRDVAWHPRHHRDSWGTGQLSMKALGFSPIVQGLCRDIEERLGDVLRDASHFSCKTSRLCEDTHLVYDFLAQAVERHFFDLSSFLETTLLYLETDSYENSCRGVVFLGHACCGIAHLCPQINVCLSPDKLKECVERSLRLGSDIPFTSAVFKENELWKDLKNKLLNLSSSAFSSWSQSQIQQVSDRIRRELATASADDMLKTLLQWDRVEIQEESERGDSLHSVLRVPQFVSTPVSNTLFAFCCKLNDIGGFAVSSEVRRGMSSRLLSAFLSSFDSKMAAMQEAPPSKLLQAQCLQVLFDVQFVCGLLSGSGEPGGALASMAAAYVDPFDMDVFSTPLQHNVKRAIHKATSLFGLVSCQDPPGAQFSGGSQADPSSMLSCPPGARFPLLPLATPHATQDPPPTKPLSGGPAHSSSPNLLDHAHPPDGSPAPLKSATSFYDRVTTAMSTSWFGN